MYLGNKRSILFFICFFTILVFKAQTLYWVGGSGNFNDGNHWSLVQGGAPSNLIPNINSDVVFENETFNDETNIIQMMEHVNKLLKTNPDLVKQVSKCVTNVMGDKSLLDKIKLIQDQTLDKSDETDDSLASTNELRQ